jgi:hypothetical protein
VERCTAFSFEKGVILIGTNIYKSTFLWNKKKWTIDACTMGKVTVFNITN